MMGNQSRPGHGMMGNHSQPGHGMMGNQSTSRPGGNMSGHGGPMDGSDAEYMRMGKTMLTSQQLMRCLRERSVENILMASERVDRNDTIEITSFLPVIDGEFLPEPIDNLLQSPHIAQYEFIFGFNDGDGSVALGFPYARGLNPDVGLTHANFSSLVDGVTDVYCRSRECAAGMKQAVTFAYTDIDKLDNGTNNLRQWLKIVRDFTFSSEIANAVRRLTKFGASVYAYEFTFSAGNDAMPDGGMTGGGMTGGGMPEGGMPDDGMHGDGMPGGGMPGGGGNMSGGLMNILSGASHGDELMFVFGGALRMDHPVLTQLSRKMMALWTNFAWNG